MAVAFGWYATVVAALAVGTLSVPSAPQDDCTAMFSCLSPLEKLLLVGLFGGAPVLVGLLIVTAAVTALLVRRISSVVLSGTLSAVVSGVACALVAGVYLGRS
ncbi:hypothetical protein GCM10027614_61510 [Micromonospora vulcania]